MGHMTAFFHLMNTAFDFILFTQGHTGRYAAIVLLSAVSAVIFMALFKKVSNQAGIKREKAKIVGNLFQMRLYKDRLSLILSSIFNVFKHNLFYIRYMLVPLIVIIIPLMIITVQVNQRCGYKPFIPGDEFIVTADLNDSGLLDAIECQTTNGIELSTPVMRIYEQGRAYWRAKVRSRTEASETISLYADNQKIGSKTIVAGRPAERFIPQKIKGGNFEAIFFNAEGFLPAASPLEKLTINYPRATYGFLWVGMDAVVLYFLLTLIFALIIKPFFKVSV